VPLETRRFVETDRASVIRLARMAHAESMFSEIDFSAEKFNRSFSNCIQEPDQFLGLVTYNTTQGAGEAVGYCYAIMGDYYIGANCGVVTVISIYSSSAARDNLSGGKIALKQINAIHKWGRILGAEYVMYHVTAGVSVDRIDRFFRRLGFSTIGGNYAVKLG